MESEEQVLLFFLPAPPPPAALLTAICSAAELDELIPYEVCTAAGECFPIILNAIF